MPSLSAENTLVNSTLTFIVASFSARAYAQALVEAGHEVVTLDAFADEDTERFAKKAYKFRLQNLQVDEEDFKRIFSSLELSQFDGFLYGSCFDAVPDLLNWVASQIQVIGNSATVMRMAKEFDFFKRLNALDICHPEVQRSLPTDSSQWLGKRLGGTGGMHVSDISNSAPLSNQTQAADYYQQKITGTPVSMLFVADGENVQCIGFNLQLVAPSASWPYRYGGAVGAYDLPQAAKLSFESAAQQLTQQLDLRGVNSLDAILTGDKLWILELNPRLSATFSLYPNAITAHLNACMGELVELPKVEGAVAQSILYANQPVEIATNFMWPDGVLDIPQPLLGDSIIRIAENSPICTVEAKSTTAELAHSAVLKKVQQLQLQLGI